MQVLLFYLKDDPPSQYMESSIEDPAPGEVIAEIQPVTFQIVESGTKRRKTSLMDSLGFSYNVHSRRRSICYVLAVYGSSERQSLQGISDRTRRGVQARPT